MFIFFWSHDKNVRNFELSWTISCLPTIEHHHSNTQSYCRDRINISKNLKITWKVGKTFKMYDINLMRYIFYIQYYYLIQFFLSVYPKNKNCNIYMKNCAHACKYYISKYLHTQAQVLTWSWFKKAKKKITCTSNTVNYFDVNWIEY